MKRYWLSIGCDSDLEGYECCSPCSQDFDDLDLAIAEAKTWDPDIWFVHVRDTWTKKILYKHG